MCQICQKEGHLKMACPEENLPPLKPLPPMTPEYEQILDRVLWRVPGMSVSYDMNFLCLDGNINFNLYFCVNIVKL